MLKTPKRLLVVFSVVAPTMLVMSAAFACTLLVGSTQQLTPAAGEGEQTQAKGEVVQPVDDFSPVCPGELDEIDGDQHCTYDYIVVDPDDALDNDAGTAGSPSCHYNKSEYGIADGNVTHEKVDDAVLVLHGDGTVPSLNADGSENGEGVTVTCFASGERNQEDDGPATATQPAPFFKTS
jgi:hypothetical protein